MRTRKIEMLLVMVAACSVAVAVVRTLIAGDTKPIYWVVLPWALLIVLTGINISLRSKNIAVGMFAVCGLFICILALWACETHLIQHHLPIWQLTRGLSIFLSLGATAWMQLRPAHAVTDSDMQAASKDEAAKWILYGAAVVIVILIIASRQWWISVFLLPIMIFRPTLLRTMGWIGGESARANEKKARRLRRQVEWMERRAMTPPASKPVVKADDNG